MQTLNTAYFNPEALTEIISLDETGETGLLANLVEEYTSSFETFLTDIQENLLSGNFPVLNRATHSLKSSSRLLGLEIIGEICFRMEKESSQGACSPDLLKQLIEARQPSLNALNEWINQRIVTKEAV